MKLKTLLVLCLTLFRGSDSYTIPTKNHSLNDYFAIELDGSKTIDEILERFPNWNYEHPARGIANHFVFSQSKSIVDSPLFNLHKNTELDTLSKRDFADVVTTHGIRTIHLLPPKRLIKRAPIPYAGEALDSSMEPITKAQEQFDIKDPKFPIQWHLINPSFPGNDINVTGVWAQNITGRGIVTAIVDDGLDYETKDLADNFYLDGSWDFNANTKLPKPTLRDDYHGTRCAGEIAAVRNDVCGVGVAYDSKVSGIRILSGEITIEDEAAALIYGLEHNDIYSCSWGPADNGKAMQAPDPLVELALIKGVSEGRKGKGAVYVYASGNGGSHGDNCNFDGYTNSIYSITVGALDHRGLHPAYSEACSAVLVVTYSSGSGEHIHSTDIHGMCSDNHGGTSAAAPLAAGIYSLVLSANPNLGWRDIQYLTILTSIPINDNDGNWQDAALSKYSHKYGYGKLDAYRIVERSKTWENVNEQVNRTTESIKPDKNIKFDETYEHDFEITQEFLSNFKNLEHITLFLNMDTTIRGQVTIDLISPSKIISNLGTIRQLDTSNEGFKDWRFMTVAHWGDEKFAGKWILKVKNHDADNKVNLKDFKLTFFGQKRDESNEELVVWSSSSTASSILSSSTESSSLSSSLSLSSSSSSSSSSSIEPTTTAPSDKSVNDPSAVSSSITSSTGEPTETSSNGESEGGKKYLQPASYYAEYFMVLVVIGFVVLLVYNKLFVARIRRSQQYEFDIIRPEDSDSDTEFELDNMMSTDDENSVLFDSSRLDQSFLEDDDTNNNNNNNRNDKNTNRGISHDDDFEIHTDDEHDHLKDDVDRSPKS